MSIKYFKEIRRNGQVIDESMSAKDIFALGSPEKVTKIQWSNGTEIISIDDGFGILAKVVPGRKFIAANMHDESGQYRTLSIISADGLRCMELSNIQKINGKDEVGEFRWFESARITSPNVFGVIFNRSSDNSMFQLDVDATNGNIVGVYPVR